jgi:hypothetical protein
MDLLHGDISPKAHTSADALRVAMDRAYAAGFEAAKAMAVDEHMETVNRIASMKIPEVKP